MRRTRIDFNKSIIYKICCKDENIKGIYIGSTTNLKSHKYKHKLYSLDKNNKNYNLPLYLCIRKYGGWENWEFVIIDNYPCNTHMELISRENYWKDTLESSLNIKNYKDNTKCIHECMRSECNYCFNGRLCTHNIQMCYCKLCGIEQLCEHNKIITKCVDCKINMINRIPNYFLFSN